MTLLPRVFISYASADLEYAEELNRRLKSAGIEVWFDKARLQGGWDWHKEIEAACEACRIVLPVLTPRWKLSEWTRFETYGAGSVIPLIFEGHLDDVATPPLLRFQALSFDLGCPDDATWERLATELRLLLEQPEPDKAARFVDMQYAPNPYFVGRERDLNRVHEALHQSPTAGLTQGTARAIVALGGVGKTALVRQYVEKFWRCYPQIFWLDCRRGVQNEFARVCERLIPGSRGLTDVGEKAHLALHELENRIDRLLIFDDAEDEASIQSWIPKAGHCRTLITSLYAAWSAAVRSIPLAVLEPQSACTLLVTRSGQRDFAHLPPVEQRACDELAKELGYLPIALEQAAAYIAQQGPVFSFVDYARLYSDAAAELLATGVLGSTEYPDSVITTWRATVAKLTPASLAILRLCAFLAPTPLPLTALFDGIEMLIEETGAISGSPLPAPSHTEVWVRARVKELRDYSMAEGDGTSISLHPLVQTVQRLSINKAEHRATLERVLKWIDAVFAGDPQDVQNWPALDPLVPHVGAAVHYADQSAIGDPTSRLMNDLGLLLGAKCLWDDAKKLLYRALAIDEQLQGSGHPDVARDAGNIGGLLFDSGQFAEAEPLLRLALSIEERAEGPAGNTVAACLNNLAELLKATNRLAEAEPLLCRALRIEEQSRGPSDPAVARTLNNLALLLHEIDQSEDAEQLLRRALRIEEHAHGPMHPRVAMCLNNLAHVLQAENRSAEAEPMMRRALAIDEECYGPLYPGVARDLNNLAALMLARDRSREAEPLLRRALDITEQVYGSVHPFVATCLNNLGHLVQTTNRPGEAEPLLRRAIAIDEQSYGPTHPSVARDLTNLALSLHATNRSTEAEECIRRALGIEEESYGRDHPSVATSLGNLAHLLQATGRGEEAEPLMRRALVIGERAHGPLHPDVARQLNNLGHLLLTTGRPVEAEPLLRRALAVDEQSYGPLHPTVARELTNLAGLLKDANQLAEAEEMMRRALSITEQSFGVVHPVVATCLNNLAVLLRETDRLAEAEALIGRALAIDEQSYGPSHPDVARDLYNLALLFKATSRLPDAEQSMRRHLEILLKVTRSVGHPHPRLDKGVATYIELLEAIGMSAAEMRARLNEILSDVPIPDHGP